MSENWARKRGRQTLALVDYERKKARDGSGQQRIELEKPVKLCRDPEKFAPFSHPELLQDIKKMHNPDFYRMKWALASLAGSVVFLAMFLLEVRPSDHLATLFVSMSCFGYSTWVLMRYSRDQSMSAAEPEPEEEAPVPARRDNVRPSQWFRQKEDSGSDDEEHAIRVSFSRADRVSWDKFRQEQKLSEMDEGKINRLATRELMELEISRKFGKYVHEMKKFIARRIMKKLVRQLSDQELSGMLEVPGFKHATSYVSKRLKEFGDTGDLGMHCGDKGMKYGKEWTPELPSDNEIVLNVLNRWFSYFMNGRKSEPLVFAQKHLSLGKEPVIEEDSGIWLCSLRVGKEGTLHYAVVTKKVGQARRLSWAIPGENAMYNALTLFFWFVKEDYDFMLEETDFNQEAMNMRQIYDI